MLLRFLTDRIEISASRRPSILPSGGCRELNTFVTFKSVIKTRTNVVNKNVSQSCHKISKSESKNLYKSITKVPLISKLKIRLKFNDI